jgi:hypothetical protein
MMARRQLGWQTAAFWKLQVNTNILYFHPKFTYSYFLHFPVSGKFEKRKCFPILLIKSNQICTINPPFAHSGSAVDFQPPFSHSLPATAVTAAASSSKFSVKQSLLPPPAAAIATTATTTVVPHHQQHHQQQQQQQQMASLLQLGGQFQQQGQQLGLATGNCGNFENGLLYHYYCIIINFHKYFYAHFSMAL